MSSFDGWYQVGPDGHLPGVAAELPAGYWVYLDAAGNIGAVQEIAPGEEQVMAQERAPVENAPPQETAPPPQQESAPPPGMGG